MVTIGQYMWAYMYDGEEALEGMPPEIRVRVLRAVDGCRFCNEYPCECLSDSWFIDDNKIVNPFWR